MSKLYRTLVVMGYVGMLFGIVGCAGMQITKTVNGKKSVYRRGEDGTNKLVYTVDRDGTTTAYDKNDPAYQKHAQKLEFERKLKEENEKRKAEVVNAVKRGANDPIYVFLETTTTTGKLTQAERKPGATHEQLKKAMGGDPVVTLIDDRAKADVIITPTAFVKEKTGIDNRTNKVVTVPMLTIDSRWKNVYTGETGNTTDSDHILRNPQLMKRYAGALKTKIRNDIGKMIPADREKYRPVSLEPKTVIKVEKVYKKK